MKIFIGITQNPENIKDYLYQHLGHDGTLTEVGPFVSRIDAMNWLVYLKCRIGNFQEIFPTVVQSRKNGLWFGFTFEKPRDN